MSSELKTNKVSPATGTALQIGDSGDTISIPSGATIANSGTATGFGADTSLSNLASGGADKIIKGWVCFGGATVAIKDSFNVSSITDNGVGSWDVNWNTDFANANYAVVAGGSANSGGGDYIQTQNTSMTAAISKVYAYTSGGGTTWDPNYVSVVAIGDQ